MHKQLTLAATIAGILYGNQAGAENLPIYPPGTGSTTTVLDFDDWRTGCKRRAPIKERGTRDYTVSTGTCTYDAMREHYTIYQCLNHPELRVVDSTESIGSGTLTGGVCGDGDADGDGDCDADPDGNDPGSCP